MSSADSPGAAAGPAVGPGSARGSCAPTVAGPSRHAAARAAGAARRAIRYRGNATMVDFLRLAGPQCGQPDDVRVYSAAQQTAPRRAELRCARNASFAMPELPEVETTRRGVLPHVEGRRVKALHVYDPRLRWPVPRTLPALVAGRTIDTVDRRSKYLLFRLGADTLLVHLGMTGSLRVFTAAPPRRRPHDHIDLVLENGTTLRYHDPRRFGAMLWLPAGAGSHPLLAALGPEPFDPAFDAAYLHRETRRRSAAIKLALMDNHLVVGVGQHLRERIAVPRRHPADDRRPPADPPSTRAARRRRAGNADRGDRQGWIDPQGLRGQPRRARLLPARLLRLRAGGAAVPRLRQPAQVASAGGPGDHLVPDLPALSPGVPRPLLAPVPGGAPARQRSGQDRPAPERPGTVRGQVRPGLRHGLCLTKLC